MKNVRARWSTAQNENIEHSSSNGKSNGTMKIEQCEQPLTLNISKIDFLGGKLIGIIGAVGSGKSSLLQALLHELPLKSGSIHIDGTISYASQEPWVFAASIRQNILFGQEYERDRYNEVIKCCALASDFKELENGDLSLIGERGSSVSGGQKARIKYVSIHSIQLSCKNHSFHTIIFVFISAWREHAIGKLIFIYWTIR